MSMSKAWWVIGVGVVAALVPWTAWIGLALIAWGIWLLWRARQPGNDPWLADKSGCQYKWAFDGTGLALDTASRTLHLKSREAQKSYPFDDVRAWRANVQTGGEIYNGSAGTNFGIHLRNKAESGFFVTVRDIEHPQWRIAFPYNKKMEVELQRWMEIFRQQVGGD